MRATAINAKGKVERNAKVLEGECIFPFKYKRQTHDKCVDTDKGAICATEVNPKTRTLTKYGYCQTEAGISKRKSTKKKTPPKTKKLSRKLKLVSSKSLSVSKENQPLSKSKSPGSKGKTMSTTVTSKAATPSATVKKTIKKSTKKIPKKLVVVSRLEKTSETTTSPKVVTAPTTKKMEKSYNEDFINVLGELADIMMRQGEPFRARAYQKAQESIMTYPDVITNTEQLKGLPGIGSTILSKLNEFVNTGTLAVLERERQNPINVLTNVYGVGPKKAKDLIDKGITTIAQLKENLNLLNENQKIGVEYYDQINAKIPRAEIDEYNTMFREQLEKSNAPKGTKFEIVGSYRRGKAFSGDIDVIITNEKDDVKAYTEFVEQLKKDKIIIWEFTKGKTKSLTLCKLPNSDIARRVDFLYTSPEEYPFAILYFTGSKIFNTVMRQRALKQGLTLNEHGLYEMSKTKVKGERIDPSLFKTEQDIFDYLGMEYKTPRERIDGRAVEDKKQKEPIEMTLQPAQKEEKKSESTISSEAAIMKDDSESKQPKKTLTIKRPKKTKQTTLKKPKTRLADMTEELKKEGASYLHTLSESELMQMITQANEAYYNESPVMSDDLFDIVKEYAERMYPNNPVLKEIGAPVQKGKVKLPYNMPSMNKIKPDTEALSKWQRTYKGPYVLSAKLDGVSGLYVYKNGKYALYTRGDGTYGQDISHMIPYMKLPKAPKQLINGKSMETIAIRGEFIVSKKTFEEKYSKEFSNARNFVAGVVNSKTKVVSRYKSMDFVAYELIDPENVLPSEQFDILKKLIAGDKTTRMKLVKHQTEPSVSNELLSSLLVEWRKDYEYEIDGVIVANDKVYQRTPENPEHSFAFKMVLGDQVAEVKVLDVLWSPSKDGYLKPRVQVEPVVLGGAKIEYATGFNAKFIEDNKIGVGAVIELVRSGDVIPHILKVIRPAEKAQMPEVPWEWNETHVDAILKDKHTDDVVVAKNITNFFKQLDTVGMGPGNVTKLVAEGYKTIPSVLDMTVSQMQEILGKKNGQTLHANIREAIDKASLPQLMTATNIFGRGFGDKRFVAILEEYPDILVSKESDSEKSKKLAKIKGLSSKSAESFVANIPAFLQFIKESGLESKLQYEAKQVGEPSHPLFGKKIVMTGFRDKELTKQLETLGAEMASSVTKNTFIVLVKNKDESTGKADEARKLGVNIMTVPELKATFAIE